MKAQLNFVNFVVPKFLFEKVQVDQQENIFEIIPQAVISRKNKQFHINIDLEIFDVENDFNLKMLCVGIFEYDTEDEALLLNFLSVNGPAIVFPYIRSFVSSFTSLSGFDTITLPTLNLSGHKERLIETLIDLDNE
ncbi:protein-export chaperone SecB [Flavobacterium sp.]|jgi:preprotein translocase subunit SecB|uniref:protein-export chaperone SecB n=1 Tax=Flavobacterium sp. TaxID=239 RepID=UPI002A834874|nr:protein-export chaperone SecB [Flavobacterium sp.]